MLFYSRWQYDFPAYDDWHAKSCEVIVLQIVFVSLDNLSFHDPEQIVIKQ